MTAVSGVGENIAALLSQELAALRSFIELLRQEQSLLVSGTSDGLVALATGKSQAALELGRLAAARDEALARIHFPAGRAGMDAWIITDSGSPSSRKWDELLDLAAEARALNEANGKLIGLHLQHNQRALSALSAAVDQTATYGPDGQSMPGVGGRSFGSV